MRHAAVRWTISRYHLAKNLGVNTVKPDVHLARLAKADRVSVGTVRAFSGADWLPQSHPRHDPAARLRGRVPEFQQVPGYVMERCVLQPTVEGSCLRTFETLVRLTRPTRSQAVARRLKAEEASRYRWPIANVR